MTGIPGELTPFQLAEIAAAARGPLGDIVGDATAHLASTNGLAVDELREGHALQAARNQEALQEDARNRAHLGRFIIELPSTVRLEKKSGQVLPRIGKLCTGENMAFTARAVQASTLGPLWNDPHCGPGYILGVRERAWRTSVLLGNFSAETSNPVATVSILHGLDTVAFMRARE